MHRVNRFAAIVLFLVFATVHARAQQPSPSPERTGRSYSTPDLPKTPPPPGPQARSPVTFNNVTAQSGVGFIHATAKTSAKYLLETMAGGIAIFDYDNDGRMDLFFTNGAALKQSMSKDELPDKSEPRYWNRLFQQKTDGTFKDVTERAGLKRRWLQHGRGSRRLRQRRASSIYSSPATKQIGFITTTVTERSATTAVKICFVSQQRRSEFYVRYEHYRRWSDHAAELGLGSAICRYE